MLLAYAEEQTSAVWAGLIVACQRATFSFQAVHSSGRAPELGSHINAMKVAHDGGMAPEAVAPERAGAALEPTGAALEPTGAGLAVEEASVGAEDGAAFEGAPGRLSEGTLEALSSWLADALALTTATAVGAWLLANVARALALGASAACSTLSSRARAGAGSGRRSRKNTIKALAPAATNAIKPPTISSELPWLADGVGASETGRSPVCAMGPEP